MIILGIETSCDETAAACVRDGGAVLSSVVHTQIAQHSPYGGVVPEIASRAHVEALPFIVETALREAGVDWSALDAVAVTRGPGLVSSLMIGMAFGQALALRLNRPLIPTHHLEAHLYALRLDATGEDAPPPEVTLLVSGGHTLLVHAEAWGRYRTLGRSLDDAAGEALDKGAKLMGLGYPGGPAIEQAAAGGNPAAFAFPRGRPAGQAEGPDFPFSFSGLKTALLYRLKASPEDARPPRLADLAASYQEAVVDVLAARLDEAANAVNARSVGCVGGVARNKRLRDRLETDAKRAGRRLTLAPPRYCTDNAAMVAGAAWLRRDEALPPDSPMEPLPRWPLKNHGSNPGGSIVTA